METPYAKIIEVKGKKCPLTFPKDIGIGDKT